MEPESFILKTISTTSIKQNAKCDIIILFLEVRYLINWMNNQKYLYSGTRLIRHTKGPRKCVGFYRMSQYSGFILVNTNTLGP